MGGASFLGVMDEYRKRSVLWGDGAALHGVGVPRVPLDDTRWHSQDLSGSTRF